ncbi:MAG: tandem-95 repeat protein, partial [Chloroflexi bacterium]|nr:tandem-95 repeat protein [Chloroflexota bacterium]
MGDIYIQTGPVGALSAPPEGSCAVYTNMSGPGAYVLYQDIAVPATGITTVQLYVYHNNTAGAFYTPASLDHGVFPNQQYRVDIVDSASDPWSYSGGVLLNLYQSVVGTPSNMGPTLVSGDLTPYAGTTVRLRFAEADNQGVINSSIDGVEVINGGGGGNNPPTTVADSYSTNEDTTLNVGAPGVLANDSDSDGDPLTAVKDSDPSFAQSFTFIANGSFTYVPQANWSGTDSFTYHATDGTDPGNVVTVTITVNAVNDPPVAVDDGPYATNEDTPFNSGATSVLDNDSDPVEGSGLTVSAYDTTSANGGTVSMAANGTFTYTPAAGWSGTDTFGYTANDGSQTDTATVTITVTAVNDAPVAVDDNYGTNEDTPLTVAAPGVLGNDSDVDSATITVSAYDATSANGGTVSMAADGSFTYTPAAGWNGTDTFGYTASDSALTDSATVTVTVAAVDDTPVAVDDNYSTNEDTLLTVAAPGVLGNDTDVDSPVLTVDSYDTTSAQGGTISMAADGSFTY